MKPLSVALIALPLLTAAASAQMYPATWKLVHPDAKALIGVDLRSLRESSALRASGVDFEKTGVGTFPMPELKLLKEIDQVLISSPGSKTPNAKGNPPLLVVLTGRFVPEHVRELFSGPRHLYGMVDIYGLSNEPDSLNMAVLDEKTLLLGDEASLRGAIDRNSKRPAPPTELMTRAAAMAADHDVWLISAVSPSEFQPEGVKLGDIASEIRGLDAGISLHDGFQFALDLDTVSAETAKMMAHMLAEQIHLSVSSKLDEKQWSELAQKLEIGSEGSRMGVKLTLDQAEWPRWLQAAQPSRNTARSTPPPVVDDKPQTIKILGLDDGPREIPFEAHANTQPR